MGLKVAGKSISIVLLAVGLPLFVVYSIFRPTALPPGNTEALAELERHLTEHPKQEYRLHSVQDDGGVIRVNILLHSVPASTEELRMQTMGALYDVQTVVGKSKTVSVWAGTPTGKERLKLLGVAFFSSITDNYTFKSGEEIQ